MSTVSTPKPRARPQRAPVRPPAACRIVLPDLGVIIPASAHTHAGFRAWAKSEDFPRRGRISFIERELFIDMSPEEIETHVKVKWEIDIVLGALNKKAKLGEFYGDGTLVTNVEADLSTEPDTTFVTWESLEAERVRLVPRVGEEGQYMEVEGSPDWVLEVVSKYSVKKDTVRLRRAYHKAGVREYWLVDARSEEVTFHILTHAESGYAEAEGRGGWQNSPVFGRRFRLVRRRGRMNFWEYDLQVKPLR